MEEERKVYRVLVGKPEGKRMDLMVVGWGRGVEWIHLSRGRGRWRSLVNTVMNLRVLAPRT
jgi:hypothetical protein